MDERFKRVERRLGWTAMKLFFVLLQQSISLFSCWVCRCYSLSVYWLWLKLGLLSCSIIGLQSHIITKMKSVLKLSVTFVFMSSRNGTNPEQSKEVCHQGWRFTLHNQWMHNAIRKRKMHWHESPGQSHFVSCLLAERPLWAMAKELVAEHIYNPGRVSSTQACLMLVCDVMLVNCVYNQTLPYPNIIPYTLASYHRIHSHSQQS